ncbi:MAG: hypothetical protein GQ527_12085, partial [Bacteroidales bacterium]|nr:hypothetical protein [Bacteroidales bacterium]
MKKLILLSVILFQVALLFGQGSLELYDHEGVEVVNGQTIEVVVEDLDAFETVSDEYFVKNNSTNDLNIRMRMEAVSLVDSTEYSFCALGNCFPPGVNETTHDFPIAAGVTLGDEGVFTGHYHAHGFEGTSQIRYTFYNVDDLNDTISFTIIFNGSTMVGPSLQMLTVDGDVLENGTNIEVLVEDLDAFETVSDEYFIRNNSTNNLNIRMRMEAVILVDSTEYSFCALGNCFPPGINETTHDYPIAAGVTVSGEGVFTGHYHAHGFEGTSQIRYTFYNVDDLNDTISFTIIFNGSTMVGPSLQML